MIKLNGVAQRIFFFPADPDTAVQYFGNLSRVAIYLPHISVLETYSDNQLRVLYESLELGAYTISIVADLACIVEEDKRTIHIRPLKNYPEVTAEASLNKTRGYGYFASTAYLSEQDGETAIDFRLKIMAELPRPHGLRMMPGRVVNRIAKSISQGRVREIADGFMEQATAAFLATREGEQLPS